MYIYIYIVFKIIMLLRNNILSKYNFNYYYFIFFFKFHYIKKYFLNFKFLNFFLFNFFFSKKNIIYKLIAVKRKNSSFKKYNYFKHNSLFKAWIGLKLKKKKRTFKKRFKIKKLNKKYLKAKILKLFTSFRYKQRSKFRNKLVDTKKRLFKTLLLNFRFFKLFFNKHTKSKKIIAFLNKFRRYNAFKVVYYFEFLLWSLLLRVYRALTLNDVFFFIKEKYVYVNGVIVTRKNFILKKNDCVQLFLNKKILFFFKRYFKSIKKKIYKVKRKFWLSLKIKKNVYKQLSRHTPSWMIPLFWYKKRMLNYIEYDYFTFSFFIIFIPQLLIPASNILLKNFNYYFIYLYNWKRVT